jgi:type VI secretion system protein ImpJ
MTSVKYQTARVHWRMGQALLPEHFQSQESSLREELRLRLSLQPYPLRGVGGLEWDAFQLRNGIVSLRQLTLLLPDGTLIDVPGNTQPPPNFPLASAGTTPTALYLHLGESKPERVEVAGQPEEDGVERVVQHVFLSSSDQSDTASPVFKLAVFRKEPAGNAWSLSEDYLPPLLRVGGSPFFEPVLKRIDSLVNTLRQVLLEDLRVNYLVGESLLAARECLKGLYRFEALRANLEHDYQAHPFELFRALHELYIELCMLRNTTPEEKVQRYEHEDLAGCFHALLEDCRRKVEGARSEITYLPFQRKEGVQVCDVRKEEKRLREARRLYLLLQKRSPAIRLELSGLKLASVMRLPVVHQFAMQGIPFRRVDKLPFQHPFSAEVEFHVLGDGQEWDHAMNEGALAFLHRPELEEVRAFLFWSRE